MDDRTLLAIINRMDAMEVKIMKKIESLQNFKFMVIGGSAVLSFLITIAFELIKYLN